MADLCALGDLGPFPASAGQNVLDGLVEWFFHSPILVKHSSIVKEHITSALRHPQCVTEKHINQVVAENLAYWMGEAKMTQAALAAAAGVSQKTISNYLNPSQRSEGTTGKHPSAKISELELIAAALHIKVWQLMRQMTPKERALYDAIERAYQDLLISAKS